jgi:hypothetical protein
MFLLTAVVSLLAAAATNIATGGRQFVGERLDFAIAGFIGGIAGLYLISWAVAGARRFSVRSLRLHKRPTAAAWAVQAGICEQISCGAKSI